MIENSLQYNQEDSPQSLGTLSTSSVCDGLFSPSQIRTSATPIDTTINTSVYQVYGVSPTEASTASCISALNGPCSTTENVQIGHAGLKKNEQDFLSSETARSSVNAATLSSNSAIVIRDPFADDLISSSKPCLHRESPFDVICHARSLLYPLSDRALMMRLPYSFNRPLFSCLYPLIDNVTNPATFLNRSPAYQPMMLQSAPVPQVSPLQSKPFEIECNRLQPTNSSQIATKVKSRSKSKTSQHVNAAPITVAKLTVPTESNDSSLSQSLQFNFPNKFTCILSSNNSKQAKESQKRTPKFLSHGKCFKCGVDITIHMPGLSCTAMNQGCLQSYHLTCVSLHSSTIGYLKADNCEWICNLCATTKPIFWKF